MAISTLTASTFTNTVRRWQIDPKHSLVEFSVRHLTITTARGRFAKVSGLIVEDAADLSRSCVAVEIEVASVDTGEAQRDAHLKSPDFFDAERYPTITFKSIRVIPGPDDRFQVEGALTIRGVTRPVTLEVERGGTVTNPSGAEVVGFSAETRINRRNFGMTFNMALEAGGMAVGEQVRIRLEIEALKHD
jgi:polyisoprenoid-binding protein YceI